jgi:C4-dicarboxylate-binding protein DctP
MCRGLSTSPDWKRRGVRPKYAATVREDLKRLGSSTAALNVNAVTGPTPGMDIKREELEALHLGSVEMIAPSLAKLGPLGLRDFEIFDLPFLFNDYAALHRVTDGRVGADLMERLGTTGIRGLAFWDNGFKQMSANRPLIQPEDFRGLKMRIQASEVLEAQMKALGAIPDQMALSDVYAALESGVVDGTENPVSNFLTQNMYKVQKFMTLSNHGYLGYVVMVKERFWRDLPGDIRAAIAQALARATTYANAIAKEENEKALERVRLLGSTALITLTEEEKLRWKNVLATTHREFRRRMGSRLLDAVYAATGTPPLG